MKNHFPESKFCQFGGYDASISRIGLRLVRASIRDKGKVSTWPMCTICSGYLQANSDPTGSRKMQEKVESINLDITNKRMRLK